MVHSGLERPELRAMIGCANVAHAELPVEKFADTGAPDTEQARQIDSLVIKDHVRIFGSYIQQADVADYFRASDLVVLPYLSATGSGVVKLAYSYGRPVLVSNVGSLPVAVIPARTGHTA